MSEPVGSRPRGGALAGFVLVALAVLASAWKPWRWDIWALEVSPAVIGMGALWLCWRRFPWTPLALTCCVLFALVLCGGAHTSYARMPLGAWVQEQLDLARNPYDRLGHLLQGVVPALLAREWMLRKTRLVRGARVFWLSACVALSISAAYELIEWWVALLTDPDAGTAFLGQQGDEWDTQWDMFVALLGALGVQLLFARLHDRQLARLADGAR